MTFGFLFDENYPHDIAALLSQQVPGIVVQMVGRQPAPPKGTSDPDLLEYADANNLCLVTFDLKTMPGHVADRILAGNRTTGVALFVRSASHGKMADDLHHIVQSYDFDDMIDRIEYLPY